VSIIFEGIEGEKKAREWLLVHGYNNIQQFDWFVKTRGKYFIIECKWRELFEPPPFQGTGLDIKQIERRRQIYIDLDIETILLVFTKCEIYYQKLFSVLEKTEYYDTKNKIRIYNISNFKVETKSHFAKQAELISQEEHLP
jgi:hypothetical protein